MNGLDADSSLVAGGALLALLALACWTDLRSRRIPNWITVPGMLVGSVLNAVHGVAGLTGALLGVATAFLVALPFFATGVLGGGDAKLLMAVGAFFGPVQFLWAALAIAVAGGVLALAEAARRRMLGPVLASCGRLLLAWLTVGPRAASGFGPRQPLAVPYGVAIAAGSGFWWFFGAGIV